MNPTTSRALANFSKGLPRIIGTMQSGIDLGSKPSTTVFEWMKPEVPSFREPFVMRSTPRDTPNLLRTEFTMMDEVARYRKPLVRQWSNRRWKRHFELMKRRERALIKRLFKQVDMDIERTCQSILKAATSPSQFEREYLGAPFEPQRQTGRSTKQMEDAPHGATYVWPNDVLFYPDMLKERTGRTDLNLISLQHFRYQLERGMRMDDVVIDHAAEELMRSIDRARLARCSAEKASALGKGVDLEVARIRARDYLA